MALHLTIGPLKIRFGLEPVPRYEPCPLADDITTAPSGPVLISSKISLISTIPDRIAHTMVF